jgi:hypothetical protein
MFLRLAPLMALLLPTAALAAPPCDDSLEPERDESGYRLRDQPTRCEGFYVSPVAAPTGLDLVRLLRGRLAAAGDVLNLAAPGLGQPVRVRGLGLPERTYYRLDGEIAPGQRFRWDLSRVARANRLAAADLGLYGYLPGPEAERVYVPLALDPPGELVAAVLGQQRSERYGTVQWRVAGLRQDGGCEAMKGDWKPLPVPEPSGQPVEIPLRDAGTAFCLQVAARPERGGDWRRGLWRIRAAP